MNTQPTSNTKDTEAVNPVQRRSERTRGGRGSGRKPLARTDGQDTPGTSVTAADVTPAAQEDTTGKLTLPPLPATPPRSGRRPDGGQVLTPSVAPKDAKQSRVGRSPVSHLAQKAGENLTKTPADAKAVVEARKGGKDAVADEAVGTAEADAEQDGEDVGKMVGTKDAGKPGGDEDLFGDLDNERDRKAEASNGNDDEATQDEGEDVDDADGDVSDVTEGELEDATDEAVEALGSLGCGTLRLLGARMGGNPSGVPPISRIEEVSTSVGDGSDIEAVGRLVGCVELPYLPGLSTEG